MADYMTPNPFHIGRDQTLAVAHQLMRQHGIRHLPVLDGGQLVGIVTERDLHLVETLKDCEPQSVTVDEAMTPDPMTVTPDTPLSDVAALMRAHRTGSAVVMQSNRLVGVFTTVDALRALAELLGPSSGAEAL